jgi:hypothetical protein
MNAVAETRTGWSLGEARGRVLSDVFRIIDEDTRRPVVSPVEKVLREGTVVGLAEHAVLVRRDGTDVPDDTAAPIIDGSGALFGVVLVFRDVTGEKRLAAQRDQSAREALEKLTEFHPQVLVSDIGMPEVDDYGLIRRIRALEFFRFSGPPPQAGRRRPIGARHRDPGRACRYVTHSPLTARLESHLFGVT